MGKKDWAGKLGFSQFSTLEQIAKRLEKLSGWSWIAGMRDENARRLLASVDVLVSYEDELTDYWPPDSRDAYTMAPPDLQDAATVWLLRMLVARAYKADNVEVWLLKLEGYVSAQVTVTSMYPKELPPLHSDELPGFGRGVWQQDYMCLTDWPEIEALVYALAEANGEEV